MRMEPVNIQIKTREISTMNKIYNILIIFMMFSSGMAAPLLAGEAASAEYLNSGEVFPAGIPLSEAVRVGDTLYLSGQVGIVPGTMNLAPGGLEGETRQTMGNIKTSLEAHGYSMNDLVKCLVMLADVSQWATFNEIYKTYFDERYPARSAFGANGLAIGAQVEIECIAVRQQ